MNIKYLFSLVVIMVGVLSIKGQSNMYNYSGGSVIVEQNSVKRIGDSVSVDLNFILDASKSSCSRTIDLIPFLSNNGNELNMPTVSFMGRKSLKEYKRRVALKSTLEREESLYIVKKLKKNRNEVSYQYTFPYQDWMPEASLHLWIDECGCGKVKSKDEELLANVHIRPNEPDFLVSYIVPEVEEVKIRDIDFEAYLDFVVNQTDIRANYMNNPLELKRLTNFIAEIKSDKDVTIQSINVIGYASPEGSYQANKKLSEGRAKALMNYLQTNLNYPEKLFTTKFGGENWEGLQEKVSQSDIEDKDKILSILNRIYSTSEEINSFQKSQALKEINGGTTYRCLLKEYYPSLRKALCNVIFGVKNYTIEEAIVIAKENPRNLSLNELFCVANSYEVGSPDFNRIFETAVLLFPKDATANTNAAIVAIQKKDYALANMYLNQVSESDDANFYNARAIVAVSNGNYIQAESDFEKAIDLGSIDSKKNILEFKKLKNSVK